MNTNNNGNQSAGVLPAEFCGEGIDCTGLTKREAFAMAAMQGLILGCAYDEKVKAKCRVAVEYADALLAELDK